MTQQYLRRKLIIDADAGIDDAMALVLALDSHKRGEVDICAITCVNGNTTVKNSQVNVLRILDVMGCPKIPVYAGATQPLVVRLPEPKDPFHGHDGFNDIEFSETPDAAGRVQREHAVEAIKSILRENPGEVTLVAMGPLTNVALAFSADEELPSLIRDIFVMGGNIEGVGNCTEEGFSACAEFNFGADPEAAYVVLDRTVCPTYIAPIELCEKYSNVPMEWRKSVLGNLDSPVATMFNRLEETWFQRRYPKSVKHIVCDLRAMLPALDRESILKAHVARVTVELSGAATRGMLVVDRRGDEGAACVKLQQAAISCHNKLNSVTIIDKMDEAMLMSKLERAFMNYQ